MTLAAIASFDAVQFLNSAISLVAAFVLGTLIGAERQYGQRSAGLRTTVLVAVGAAAFVDIGMRLNGNASAAHVLAYVVSGGIGPYDVLIAGQALACGLTLVTRNVREFERVEGLQVENWEI